MLIKWLYLTAAVFDWNHPPIAVQFKSTADVGGGSGLGQLLHGITLQRIAGKNPLAVCGAVGSGRFLRRPAPAHNTRFPGAGVGSSRAGPSSNVAPDAPYETRADRM